jgi:ABC-type sulfate/molybdate transport systems ATPase subunit
MSTATVHAVRAAQTVLVQGLVVELGGRRALDGLDLAVAEREHVLVVGRSGAGKTTLLRALAGLARPVAGRVELYGAAASDGARLLVPPERRRIGFLFQGGALWPHMDASRQLAFVLRHAGAADVPRRVRELLEWVELAGYEKRMPATLSGGEAQRLALARALAADPKLLLLDEPLGPLDAELRGALLAKLGELQQRLGLTVIHVTHASDEARSIATRVLELRGGRIAAELAP